ncbi:MAG TPA: TIR domain-containing protein [Pyrinomonadaceae bacterium]|nr:TIR domain-containing protein [Pyrinomonadaceae bacterium]
MAKYDLAISFAGAQRLPAESLARQLDAAGYSIFYDQFEAAELWGRDLSLKLGDVYAKDARYCLVILSKEYVEKAWTNFERQRAISRFMREKGNYILCLKLDDLDLPGLPEVIGYIDFRNLDEEAIGTCRHAIRPLRNARRI